MQTFWRLLGFLRPYRRGAIWSFVLAFGALIGTVLIPYLTGVAINAVRAHDRQKLVLLAYYNGWSREQLAAKFEAPVNTVKTWLRRSMMDIRECLGL